MEMDVMQTDPAKWPLVASLSNAWKARMATFRHLHDTLYFTTFDRRVFAHGSNEKGLLGVAHSEPTNNEPVELTELNNQDVIDFDGGVDFRVALTKSGRVYTWNGEDVLRPKQVKKLPEEIVSIKCGAHYTVAITKDKRLYIWGDLNGINYPKPVVFGVKYLKIERVLSTVPKLIVICDNESVFEFIAGKAMPLKFDLNDDRIIESVISHSVMSENKSACVFRFKKNYAITTTYIESNRILNDTHCKTVQFGEKEISFTSKAEFINIEYGQLVENCQDRLLLVEDDDEIKTCEDGSFVDSSETYLPDAIGVHANYKISPSMMSIYMQEDNLEVIADRVSFWTDKLADSFDRPENADLVFQFDKLTIHAHRFFLKLMSEYMKTRLSEKWLDESIIEVTEYSYAVYYRYLRFLYTGKLSISNVQELFEVYDLANCHLENDLKQYCLNMLNDLIELDTACQIFEFTLKYELEEFNDKIVRFIKKNLDLIPNDFVKEMDKDMAKELLIRIIRTKISN